MLKKFFFALFTLLTSLGVGHAQKTTLEHKIAQMFVLGFYGSSIDEDSPIIQDIKERHLGGIILFDIQELPNIHREYRVF